MYAGGFEKNFPKLSSSSNSFEGSDGKSYDYTPWPSSADGLRVSYMEKSGKKFVAVRVSDGTDDVVLKNDLVMVPGEHFSFGTHLSGQPTLVEDNIAMMRLLEDIIKRNRDYPEIANPLLAMRTRFKGSASTPKQEPAQ